MKKILHVITRGDWAGAQKVLYYIIKGIKEKYPKEFEFEVATGSSGPLLDELKKINVKYHIIKHLKRKISPVDDIKAYFELKKLIKNGNYDIVHLHSSKAGFLGRIAAKKVGVKKVIHTVHGWWSITQYKGRKRKILIAAERIAARYCDYLVLLCEKDRRKAEEWKIGNKKQYIIIHNAVPSLKLKKGKLRKELGIDENIKIIGNVARLDAQKNPIRFLKVAKELIKIRKDVVFVWIGGSVVSNEYSEKVQQFLNENSELKDRCYFLGFRKDAQELMCDFDVFFLSSDEEGMPLVILEAISQGTPVLSTDVGCISEVIGLDNVVNVYAKNNEIARKLNSIINQNTKKLNQNTEYCKDYWKMVHAYAKLYFHY